MPSSTPAGVDQRIVEAGVVLASGAAVTGWAALRWLGATWFDGLDHQGAELPVVLASASQDIAEQEGFRVCEERLSPLDIIEVDGLRVVTPVRAVFFEMRYAESLVDAVIAMDMAAYFDLASIEEEADYIAAHPGWTGVPRARKALPWCEENSWSPYETRLRIACRRAGLPPPLCNRPVFDLEGRYVGTPDLLDLEHGHVVQYEGAVHLAVGQRAKDVQRDERFRGVGLETTSVFSVDIAHPHRLIPRLQAANLRAHTSGRRDWTVDAPSWWHPSWTVEQRRALTGPARAAMLRQRAWLAS